MERHRIHYRGQARRMARAIVHATDEQLLKALSRVQTTDEQLLEVLSRRHCADMRRMARKFATMTNDKLDGKMSTFLEILHDAGFGGDNFEGLVDEFCEQIKMEKSFQSFHFPNLSIFE